MLCAACRLSAAATPLLFESIVSPQRDAADQDTEHHQQLAQSGAAVQSSVAKRRKFTAADKLRIIRKADECLASGQRGALEALLRQEGIYASQLGAWHAKLASSGSTGLTPAKAGRKPKHTAAERRLAELEKRNAELERKLHVAEVLIALQKKRTSCSDWPCQRATKRADDPSRSARRANCSALDGL